jgi:hypothetical protein
MAKRMVTCDMPIEREALRIYFAYVMNALCVGPLWRGRRQADNPFPPIPASASHDRSLRWQRWFVFADPVPGAVQRLESLTYPLRKNRMASDQVIGVASEAAPGHWQPCVPSNVVANVDWGSRRQGGASVAEARLADKWSHRCHHQPAVLAVLASYLDRTCELQLTRRRRMTRTCSLWTCHRKRSVSVNS